MLSARKWNWELAAKRVYTSRLEQAAHPSGACTCTSCTARMAGHISRNDCLRLMPLRNSAGTDMFSEIAGDAAEDLIVLHDALDFGHCHLALGIPMGGRFASIDSLEQLKVAFSAAAYA